MVLFGNEFYTICNNPKLITSLPDPEHHFKFGNLMKDVIFQQKTTIFITFLNISTLIHHKPKLTFGKTWQLQVTSQLSQR